MNEQRCAQMVWSSYDVELHSQLVETRKWFRAFETSAIAMYITRRDVATVRYVNSAPQHHSNDRTVVLLDSPETRRPRNQKGAPVVRGNMNPIDTIDSRIQHPSHARFACSKVNRREVMRKRKRHEGGFGQSTTVPAFGVYCTYHMHIHR